MANALINFLQYRAELYGLLFPEFVYYTAIGLVIVSILRSTYVAYHPPVEEEDKIAAIMDLRHRHCASCGWQGDIPRSRCECPKCGQCNFTD
jgi:hypothetical protein